MIIDWANAAVGPAVADVADAWLIIASGKVSGDVLMRSVAMVGQRHFADQFLRASDADISSVVGMAAGRRLADKNLDRAERDRISAAAAPRRRG